MFVNDKVKHPNHNTCGGNDQGRFLKMLGYVSKRNTFYFGGINALNNIFCERGIKEDNGFQPGV